MIEIKTVRILLRRAMRVALKRSADATRRPQRFRQQVSRLISCDSKCVLDTQRLLRSVRGLRRKRRLRNLRHRLPRVAAAALLRNPPHPRPPVAAVARPPSPPCPQAADVAGRQPLRRNNLPQRSATPRASSQVRLPNQTWDSPAATPPRSHHSALAKWCWILAQAAGSTALWLAQRSAPLAK